MSMIRCASFCCIVVALSLLSSQAVAAPQGGFPAARAWADRVFAAEKAPPPPAFLKLAYEDVAENITRGKSWRGTPYAIGGKTYAHGIAYNSTKHLLVQLGRPAARFTANVGLENNDDTQRGAAAGHGSVTFHVLVGGKEVFTSPVRRLKDEAVRVDVALDGAMEFEIRVKDGGDGRAYDQAVWAEAAVSFADGTKLRLQDIPLAGGADNPFAVSFLYGGKHSRELLPQWAREQESRKQAGRELRRVTYRDPATGLELRIEAVLFEDFPAVEWVAYLKNTGKADTPILESIQAMEGAVPLATAGSARLHWAKGAVASFDDFAPQEAIVKAGTRLHLQPGGGRSSNQVLPFFNLEGAGGGVMTAVGWTGEWAADFAADSGGRVMMTAGMAHTKLLLHPGESIRTPRMLLMFYDGDRWVGQNLLRRFILAHHRPKRNGQPLVAPITCGNWGGTRAEIHLDNIRRIVEHKLPLEYYWIDAEWYGQMGGPGTWAANVGNWEVKKPLYPEGFKPLSDALRKSGRELMLWFEPERVVKGTPWHREHGNWVVDVGAGSCMLNLGNPEARRFLTDFISARIDEFGLGCYRQDFNFDPLPFWKKNDEPNREGISEIRYIEGLYAFWDELLQRHPGLLIDNCASGGRRIDLETVGRATPFWRTDGPRDAIAHQCHTYGLMAWVPLHSTSQDRAPDDYEFRSSMSSALCLNWWVSGDAPAERIPDSFPFDWARKTLEQYVKLRPLYYGDYYPLTGYSQSQDLWIAYQLDRPELGRGLVVALRRPASPYERARFALRGLDPAAMYEVTDLDSGERTKVAGKDLVSGGLEVQIGTKPGSCLLLYEKR